MKALWLKLAGRFDAMQRRERLMVFAGSVFAVALLGYQFLVEPQLLRHSALVKQLNGLRQSQVQFALKLADAEKRTREPSEQGRKELEDTRRHIVRIEQEHQAVQSRLVAPDAMATLLEGMLRKNRGLSLVALTTLPAGAVAEKPAAEGKKTEEVTAPASGLYKHGVRITVRGSYADLLEFLVEMENLPQKMYWGRVALAAEKYPVSVMQVTVYTLSLDKSWLVI